MLYSSQNMVSDSYHWNILNSGDLICQTYHEGLKKFPKLILIHLIFFTSQAH